MSEFVLPKFLADEFIFENSKPPHKNKPPLITEYYDFTYSLFRVPRCNQEPDFLAVDIPDITVASSLIVARLIKQEPIMRAYGVSEDLFLRSPCGDFKQVYNGLKGRYNGSDPFVYMNPE